jgi:tRNA (guanine9-N1)-methyltransferase
MSLAAAEVGDNDPDDKKNNNNNNNNNNDDDDNDVDNNVGSDVDNDNEGDDNDNDAVSDGAAAATTAAAAAAEDKYAKKAYSAREYWKYKRQKDKEKRKLKKEQALAAGLPFKNRVRNSRWLGEEHATVWERDFVEPTICIDAKFTHLLTDKERRGLRTQISHIYGFMRRIDKPCHLWVANLDDLMRNIMFSISNAKDWPIRYSRDAVLTLFPPDRHRVVYLSPDATELLDDVHADTVYVVGGIVDHNRLKNTTVAEAKELGLRSARLPIFETIKIKMNNSLNVNHVYEILCTQLATHNWAETFRKCLPKRVCANVMAPPPADAAAATSSTTSAKRTNDDGSSDTAATAAEPADNPTKMARVE